MSFLFMFHVNIATQPSQQSEIIGKQDHSYQPKLVWRTSFGCQKLPPGSVLVAKFCLARTTVGTGGHFWQQKSDRGTTFGQDRFRVTVLYDYTYDLYCSFCK